VSGRGQRELLLATADVVLTGEFDHDRFGTLASTPRLDLDGDRIDDLLIGAARSDVTAAGGTLDLGKGPVFSGARTAARPATQFQILANRTVTGSGDFLVDRNTGQPDLFSFTLPAGQGNGEAWYRFTTQGDGQAQSYLRVTNPAQPARTDDVNGVTGSVRGTT